MTPVVATFIVLFAARATPLIAAVLRLRTEREQDRTVAALASNLPAGATLTYDDQRCRGRRLQVSVTGSTEPIGDSHGRR